MERRKISEFPQEVLNLFDLYIHGDINRRDFIESAGKIVGAVAAAGMLESLEPNYAMAQQVAPDDKRIKASWETFDSPNGTGKIKGYLVRPANANGKLPGVLVVHENRGLNPYVQDVVRRLATAGFMAFGPDALSSLGGYPKNWASYVPGKQVDAQEVSTADGDATKMQASLDGKKTHRGLGDGSPMAERAFRLHGQDRRRRFLLWRRHLQYPCGSDGSGSRRLRSILRCPTQCRGRG